MRIDCDYLVLGSGVAGLTCALEAAKHGKVAIVTKRTLADSNTSWAQGGIAAVMAPGDTFEAHAEDTLRVGYGLSKRDVVQMVVEGGPARIKELIELGANFDAKGAADEEPAAVVDGVALDLTREGGHTARRVVHAGDVTGREVQRVLMEAARRTPNIEIFEHHMAIDLLELSKLGGPHQVAGAYVLDEKKGEVHAVLARATIRSARPAAPPTTARTWRTRGDRCTGSPRPTARRRRGQPDHRSRRRARCPTSRRCRPRPMSPRAHHGGFTGQQPSNAPLIRPTSTPSDMVLPRSKDRADVAQLVAHHLAKVRVAGSNPVVRSETPAALRGRPSVLVEWPRGEATACKAVYTGSNPVSTSTSGLCHCAQTLPPRQPLRAVPDWVHEPQRIDTRHP